MLKVYIQRLTLIFGNDVGYQTGISHQFEDYQKNTTGKNFYLHSQAHLIAKEGAENTDKGHTYNSYGGPMSDENINESFSDDKGRKPKELQKNEGDYVAHPENIFKPSTYPMPGHGTENYGAAKAKKELQERLKEMQEKLKTKEK